MGECIFLSAAILSIIIFGTYTYYQQWKWNNRKRIFDCNKETI